MTIVPEAQEFIDRLRYAKAGTDNVLYTATGVNHLGNLLDYLLNKELERQRGVVEKPMVADAEAFLTLLIWINDVQYGRCFEVYPTLVAVWEDGYYTRYEDIQAAAKGVTK